MRRPLSERGARLSNRLAEQKASVGVHGFHRPAAGPLERIPFSPGYARALVRCLSALSGLPRRLDSRADAAAGEPSPSRLPATLLAREPAVAWLTHGLGLPVTQVTTLMMFTNRMTCLARTAVQASSTLVDVNALTHAMAELQQSEREPAVGALQADIPLSFIIIVFYLYVTS